MKFKRFNFKFGKGDGEHTDADRVNKVVYITAVCLLLGIVILAAFTTAANRGRKPLDTGSGTSAGDVTSDTGTSSPGVTTPPDTNVSEDVPVLSLPVDGILGMDHDPDLQVFSQTMGDWRVHTGIDIICAEGASVYCAADGTVLDVYEDPMMGYSVAVKHAGGLITLYQNLSSSHASGISEGSSVKGGQLIGTVGDSAMLEIAEEAHLHFAVFLEEDELDPITCMSESAQSRLLGEDNATE